MRRTIDNVLGRFFISQLSILLLLAIPSFSLDEDGRIDLVIVLDVSGSMRSNSLIEPVTAMFNQTVNRLLNNGDTVTLITFGTGSYDRMATVVVESGESTQQLKNYVDTLEFNDASTYHALAIKSAFEKCSVLERQYPHHERVILFLTDGRNDPPSGLTDEITLDEVRADSSAYNTDWFVVHIQMNQQENTEIGRTLSAIFGNHYLFSSRLEDAFDRLDGLLQSFIFVDYDPSREITIDITGRDTEISGYTDILLSTTSPNEIPAEQIHFVEDFPDLPDGLELNCHTEVLSDDRLRVFIGAMLTGNLPSNEFHGFYCPVLENAGQWQMGGSIQSILVNVNVAVRVDTVRWEADTDELDLEVSELQSLYQTRLEVTNIPFEVDTSLISVQFDGTDIPAALTVNCIVDHSISGKAVVTLTASADSAVSNGDYSGDILVGLFDNEVFTADRLAIHVVLKTSIVPPTWPKTLGVIVGGVLLVVTGVFFLRRHQQSKLFGTFHYWSADSPGTRKREDISTFGTAGEIGNRGVVVPGASKRMASLKVTVVGGNRFVTVFPEPGTALTLNDRKQASIRLHNHDVFHLGSWIFEYKGRTVRRKTARR